MSVSADDFPGIAIGILDNGAYFGDGVRAPNFLLPLGEERVDFDHHFVSSHAVKPSRQRPLTTANLLSKGRRTEDKLV